MDGARPLWEWELPELLYKPEKRTVFVTFQVTPHATTSKSPLTQQPASSNPWWLHQMETFSALLAISAGHSLVTGEFPAQRPVTQTFDVFVDLHPNKRLSKQSWGWWFETPPCPLWRHCNAVTNHSPTIASRNWAQLRRQSWLIAIGPVCSKHVIWTVSEECTKQPLCITIRIFKCVHSYIYKSHEKDEAPCGRYVLESTKPGRILVLGIWIEGASALVTSQHINAVKCVFLLDNTNHHRVKLFKSLKKHSISCQVKHLHIPEYRNDLIINIIFYHCRQIAIS